MDFNHDTAPAVEGANTSDAEAPIGADAQDQITVTRFPDHAASRKTEVRGTWAQLRGAILRQTAPTKAALPWIKLARFWKIAKAV